MTYHTRVSASGEVVLPADLARSLGLSPGDRLQIDRSGGGIVLKTDDDVVRDGQIAFATTIARRFTVDDFIADRRADADRD